ncbi:hypothetical protein EDD86DRAFT_246067 [Gorgonomyces haynaldii]|nr:hypothetical protein EDD86DRAFT_246067 [Gorgonomyces haynaldii]
MQKYAAVAISVALGAMAYTTFKPLTSQLVTKVEIDYCKTNAHSITLGLQAFDQFMCLVTPLFQSLLRTRENLLIARILYSSLFSFWLVAGIESTRSSARGFVKHFGIFTIICHFFGIGMIMPLLWVPSAILKKPETPLSIPRNWLVLFTCLGYAVVGYKLMDPSIKSLDFAWLIILFHLISVFMQVLWILYAQLIDKPVDFLVGSANVQTIYNIATGVLGIWWISTFNVELRPYLDHGIEGLYDFFLVFQKLFTSSKPQDLAGKFFFADFGFHRLNSSCGVLSLVQLLP